MKMPDKIRLLVVDDHFTIRMGLTALINMESDMEFDNLGALVSPWWPGE